MKTVDFEEGNYVKYHIGSSDIYVYIDAVHTQPPKSDLYTDKIVYGVIKKTNCSGLVSKISRETADLNRPICKNNKKAILEYREAIYNILNNLNILDKNNNLITPFLHIAIHGMKNYENKDIEIGTLNNTLCNYEISKWFINQIENNFRCKIALDDVFSGDPSLLYHINGDPNYKKYKGYNNNYNVLQVELSRNLREKYIEELIILFSNIVLDFTPLFCSK